MDYFDSIRNKHKAATRRARRISDSKERHVRRQKKRQIVK